MLSAKTLSLSSIAPASETEFERDVVDWLSGVRSGHLGKWRYEYEPAGSPAAGGPIWEELAERTKPYYVSREGDRALVQSLDFIADAVGDAPEWVFDFGPGTLRPAIKGLLNKVANKAVYVPVDVSAQFLKAAQPLKEEGIVRDVMPCLADFTRDQIGQQEKGKKLFLFLGSTFGNLPTTANSDPSHEALKLLRHIRKNMNAGDRFLLVTDGNQDQGEVLACYTGPLNHAYYAVIPHKIAIDLRPSGHFNPAAWRPDVRWWPETSQCSHGLVTTEDQLFSIGAQSFHLPKGTRLNASNSYKFTAPVLERLMNEAGFKTRTHTPQGNPLVLAMGMA